MSEKVLVTGVPGNVGTEVVNNLLKRGVTVRVAARNTVKAKELFGDRVEYAVFDFANKDTFAPSLEGITKVFLMRPPAISDVMTYIFPFVDEMKKKGINQCVLLSLQGAEYNVFAPHRKIEDYMKQVALPYTFLRPSFFMQNLNTTHGKQIKERSEICVPAGKGRTSFVDVRDIGEVAAVVMTQEGHLNCAYTLTGTEALTYYEVAEIISKELGRTITYTRPSGSKFAEVMKSEGYQDDMIKVMKVIYMVAKLRLAAGLSNELETLLGRKPITFSQYAKDYRNSWI
jgi:uncharacterized protein YbjT (DUF2867 family)